MLEFGNTGYFLIVLSTAIGEIVYGFIMMSFFRDFNLLSLAIDLTVGKSWIILDFFIVSESFTMM